MRGGDADPARLSERSLLAALENWSSFAAAGFNLSLAMSVPLRVLRDLPAGELVAKHRPASAHWPGIILQVNEDEIVRDLKLAQEVTAALRASGIGIAIDDFGAGYSSLASLRELPFAEIKLDRTFVRDCASDATNGAICQTAIDLAQRLNGAAAAKGIESHADLQALMSMGCDFGQGDLISPALSKAQFLDLLHQRVERARPQAPATGTGATRGTAHMIDRVA